MTSMFTCISCRVAFVDANMQRQHYKTDWHRYNLKRKVAELPPVSSEEFQIRVLLKREQDEAAGKDTSVYCNACHKTFNTPKSFENHLKSKKHLSLAERLSQEEETKTSNGEEVPETSGKQVTDNVISKSISKSSVSDEDSEIDEVDSDEWDEEFSDDNPILRNDCLFCPHHSATMMKNVKHMSLTHSFFIPDIEYLCDIKGLLCYLGEKIMQGYMCIWCNDRGKAFYSAESAQQHMIDKGHCKMLHDGEALLEYSDYYDYSKSYPDGYSNELDEEVTLPVIEDENFQLVLPSGSVIGHRSLMRYYRQNIDPNRVVAPFQKRVNQVLAQYKALGWTADKPSVAKKVRDLRFMKRVQSKYNMKLGVKANKLTVVRPQVNY